MLWSGVKGGAGEVAACTKPRFSFMPFHNIARREGKEGEKNFKSIFSFFFFHPFSFTCFFGGGGDGVEVVLRLSWLGFLPERKKEMCFYV